jgi:formylglycine-generating enzyme required for sulfatase activity
LVVEIRTATMPLQTGQVLNNRYRIVKLLGQGGFGAVYKAWDLNMEASCAVKENLDTSPEAQRQFKREAIILHKLRHPNLPQVSDHFSVLGQGQYLVMDYVEGGDLQEKLNQAGGPLPESQVLPWIEQVCDALTYLHNQSPPIIHRDIKPANIKITPKGNAMLVDFGIAKVFDPVLSTTIGARAITPGYSPHEQYGQGKTDARTDIYALGATLYTLLTGQVPVESIQRVVKDPLPAPERINPALSPGTSAAISKAMRVDSDLRWDNTTDFKKALVAVPPVVSTLPLPQTAVTQAANFQPVATQPMNVQPRPFNLGRLPKWLPYAAGLVVLVLLVTWLWPDGGSDPLAVTQTALVIGGTQTVMAFATLPTVTPMPPVSPMPPVLPLTPEPTFSSMLTETPVSILSTVTALPPNPTIPSLGIGSTQLSPIDGMVLVYIPAGEFEMGNEAGSSDERPVHTVYLDAFWMDQTEVTNGSGYGDDYPASAVTWNDAQAYCQWAGRRLPTEAEWEKAARGGLVGKKYPWGDEAPVCTPGAMNGAQYIGCGREPVSVKTFAPNGYGLYDMVGSVWEWVADWYQSNYYDRSPSQNPLGPESGDYHVLRGGGWNFNVIFLGVAYRNFHPKPEFSYPDLGFRCVVDAGP